jgi:16S rRNA (cytosine1402-N4)-methyltransferase
MTAAAHIPVLLDEVVSSLAPTAGDLIVDATFGAGGYSRAILAAAECRVLALDRDPSAGAAARAVEAEYPARFAFARSRFSELAGVVAAQGHLAVAGVVFDIGVSSMQLDQPARGFSFRHDGPLDMRMGADGPTAADIVNTASEERLADILFHFGEERQARRIARAIAHDRTEAPFNSTQQLAGLVQRVLKAAKIDGRHAATRTFQALRIAVNDELGELARGLVAAEAVLRPGGRLAVVTFHSLEDAIVKSFLRLRSGRLPQGSRHAPASSAGARAPTFITGTGKPMAPSASEIAGNPRARSARLRVAVRTDAPSLPLELAAVGVPDLNL